MWFRGDGLDLVQKILGGSVTEAAYEVANIIGIDTRSACPPAYRCSEIKAQQDELKRTASRKTRRTGKHSKPKTS